MRPKPFLVLAVNARHATMKIVDVKLLYYAPICRAYLVAYCGRASRPSSLARHTFGKIRVAFIFGNSYGRYIVEPVCHISDYSHV
jgi:hypothetical protein